jgi:hypothetical protein
MVPYKRTPPPIQVLDVDLASSLIPKHRFERGIIDIDLAARHLPVDDVVSHQIVLLVRFVVIVDDRDWLGRSL